MKKIIILLLLQFSILSCKTQHIQFNKKLSNSLYEKQRKLSESFAFSPKWERDKFIRKIKPDKFKLNDTIWLIERINEVDQSVIAQMWSNNRDKIIIYSNLNEEGFKSYKITYSESKNPLISITEKFDTVTINSKKSNIILGAGRVFINQITKTEIQTYYFRDIF